MDMFIRILGFFHLKTPIKKVLNTLLHHQDNIIWRYFGFPVFTVGLPSIALLFYSNNNFKNSITEYSPSIASVFNNHPVLSVVVSGLLIYSNGIIDPILDYYGKRFQPFKTSPLTILHKALEILVDAKLKRFEQYLLSLNNTDIERRDTFKSITKPGEQLKVLTYVIYEYFKRIDPEIDFKVRIVKVEDNNPSVWLTYEPRESPPRTDIGLLQNRNSTICRSIDRMAIQIIEDIKKCDNKFLQTRSDVKGDIGSVLCYPVVITQNTVSKVSYIISVSASKPRFFTLRQLKYYKWLMDQFALRLMLEHTLGAIKEKVNGNE